MIKVNSSIKLNKAAIQMLSDAVAPALEMTAEHLHEEVQQAQVMPFNDPRVTARVVYGKRGRYAKNGREYKGKLVYREKAGGNLQNESTFVDTSKSSMGKVSIVSTAPYARRLYFHPEYNFDKGENPNAGGEWYKEWLEGGEHEDSAARAFKRFYKKVTGI